MGNFFIVSCFVDSWWISHVLHLIFAEDPKFSGRVKCSRQSINVFGALLSPTFEGQGEEPRSSEMSQKGSMVVETFLRRDKERQFVSMKERERERERRVNERKEKHLLAKLTDNIRLQATSENLIDDTIALAQ